MRECKREPDGPGYWICHRCGSLWSDMLAGTGWHPLSCPRRQQSGYAPQPGTFDKIAQAIVADQREEKTP